MKHRETSGGEYNSRLRRASGFGASWLLASVATSTFFYYNHSERDIVLADHEATVGPTSDGYVTAHLGVIPDIRVESNSPFNQGVDIDFGNSVIPGENGVAGTELQSAFERFGVIGAQPSGEIALVRDSLKDMAITSAELGGLIGTLPIGAYILLGARRRRELADKIADDKRISLYLGGVVLAATSVLQATPSPDAEPAGVNWKPLVSLVPELANNDAAVMFEIHDNSDASLVASFVEGGFQTYEKATQFYGDLDETVKTIADQLHQPESGQTAAIVVADRHDNISMDPIVRRVAEEAGVTIVLDAGDDTSSGAAWEEFSLRSLTDQFKNYAVFDAGGNHDNADSGFMADYFTSHGVKMPTKEPATISNITVLSANDPRQSDYTPERREGEKSVDEVGVALADKACSSEDRINVILVHDAGAGAESLLRGCVDLVVAGHAHEWIGPDLVTGENGATGYSFTNTTTGGATYAFALGPKLRADAGTAILTFNETGKPVGLQAISITTSGDFEVGEYQTLMPGVPETVDATTEAKKDDDTLQRLGQKDTVGN